MKLIPHIVILLALSIAIGYRAMELAPYQQKPNQGWSSGNIKSFVAGVGSKDEYLQVLTDRTAAQRIGSNFVAAKFVQAMGAVNSNSFDGRNYNMNVNTDKLYPAIGLWYGLWFALTLLILWRAGLFVWLALFTGVMANSILMAGPGSWQWDSLPWDGPVLAFAAYAITSRRPLELAACCIAGMLFKETIIVFTILFLFWRDWPLFQRLSVFSMVFSTCIIVKLAVTWWLYGAMPAPAGGAWFLYQNFVWLFSFHPNSVLLAGGGLLLAWLFTRPKLEHILIFAIFVAAIFALSNLKELRHFNELLPMAAIGLKKCVA